MERRACSQIQMRRIYQAFLFLYTIFYGFNIQFSEPSRGGLKPWVGSRWSPPALRCGNICCATTFFSWAEPKTLALLFDENILLCAVEFLSHV